MGPTVSTELDRNGVLPLASAHARDFARNGSYLVLRQLAQNVSGFWRFLDSAVSGWEGDRVRNREQLAAQFVGRQLDGTPLAAPAAASRNDNEFGFADNPLGARCPIGAHIRRANPRDSLPFRDARSSLSVTNRHRILRRGRVYGAPLSDPLAATDEGERGLLFTCLNADIGRQFEAIQHGWINDPTFGGLYNEQDPLVGSQPTGGGSLTIGTSPVRRRLHGIPRFVTVRGGGYFFLPSLSALRFLSALSS